MAVEREPRGTIFKLDKDIHRSSSDSRVLIGYFFRTVATRVFYIFEPAIIGAQRLPRNNEDYSLLYALRHCVRRKFKHP